MVWKLKVKVDRDYEQMEKKKAEKIGEYEWQQGEEKSTWVEQKNFDIEIGRERERS